MGDEEEDEPDRRLQEVEGEEEDVVSLGLDTSKVDKINQQIDQLAPSWTEKYNEFKCQQGIQVHLEDSEVPADLHQDTVYEETMQLHKSQMQATTDRESRATR